MSSPQPDNGEELTSTNKRRSGRVSKKPEYLIPESTSTKRKRDAPQDADDVDDAEDESDESDEGEAEDDEPAEEEVRERRARKSKSAPKRPAAKKPKTNGAPMQMPIRNTAPKKRPSKKGKAGAVPNAGEVGGLYAEVFSGSKAVEEVASKWMQRFEEHESNALAEIVNFVLKCCGCDSEITNYDIEDVDGATNKVSDLQDEFQAQNVSDYPIIAKTRFATTLKSTLVEFFSVLVKTIDATGILFASAELIDNLHVWLTTMTSAQNRPFRHTATVASLAIMTALAEIGRDLATAAATAQRQSESMSKGKGANKKRASGLLQDAEAGQEKQKELDRILQDWFDTVFIHRYRDVDPKIRVDCAQALGEWIVTYPDVFFDGAHLRYLGWVLSDAHWPARLEVVKQLRKLYEKKDRLAGLKTFTERFRARMVEMATLDSEPTVRASAVELLDLLRQAGFLEPDDIDAVGRLIFDSEARVRKAVVQFFSSSVDEIYEGKVEELGGEDAVTEELGDSAESEERPGLPWLHLKCLVEVLDIYDQFDPEVSKHATKGPGDNYRLHAEELESRFIIVADTLYPSMDILKDWDTLAKYLLYDTSDGGQNGVSDGIGTQIRDLCKLSEREEFILLEILNVSIRQHVGNLVDATVERRGKKTKRQRDDLADEQESTAREITTLIPQLLKRFGDSPQTVLAVLRLERIVSLDAFSDFQQDSSTYKNLLDDIEKQFLSHGSGEVLNEASRALLRAKAYSDLGDVTEEKIEELWDETLETFRRLIGNVDLTARGNLSSKIVDGLTKTTARIERLAAISNPISHLDAIPTAPTKSKRQSSAAPTSAFQLLINLTRRAILDTDVQEDPSYASAEDTLSLTAARVTAFYTLWSLSLLKTSLEESNPPDSAIDSLATSRDAFISSLIEVLASRPPSAPIALEVALILLDAHIAGASLRDVTPKEKGREDYLALALDMSPDVTSAILKVFGALEQRFARVTGKHIEKVKEGRKGRTTKKVEERPVDAEPLDEDELERDPEESAEEEVVDESSDEEDEEEGVREQRRLHTALTAEQRLCEFGVKLVFATMAGVVDEKVVRKRLEVNKTKLGVNYKEVIRLLEEKKKGKKAPEKPKVEKKKEVVVVESEDEDEDDGMEEDDEDEPEAEAEEEQEKEVESVLGD
ncbi:STAG domain-containing protein [Elsinoe fawcettii]|nr:STAG domain-containing protein [Elsinoe fawcettii]